MMTGRSLCSISAWMRTTSSYIGWCDRSLFVAAALSAESSIEGSPGRANAWNPERYHGPSSGLARGNAHDKECSDTGSWSRCGWPCRGRSGDRRFGAGREGAAIREYDPLLAVEGQQHHGMRPDDHSWRGDAHLVLHQR